MAKNSQIFITLFIFLILIFSCKKEEEKKSLKPLKPYDYAQGVWYLESDCQDIPSGFGFINEILPEDVDIEGEGEGLLSLTTLDTIVLYGDINDTGYIVIEEQELFSFDTIILGFFPLNIPFTVSGSGVIASQDSGYVNLDYAVTVPPLPISLGGLQSFDFSCIVRLSRDYEGEDPDDPGE